MKYLAEYAQLDLEELGFDPQAVQNEMGGRKRTDLFDDAARYFAAQLWSGAGEPARKYLLGRGFNEKTLREAGWGFCKSDQGLLQHLQKTGADVSLVKELGLVRADGLDFTANGNGVTASPNGYIIYPHVWNGRTVYFSGRALKPVDPNDKSRNLPGERQVYWALVPCDPNLIIVEGQSDAESLRQLGRSALALCGVGNLPAGEIERIQKRRAVHLVLDHDLHKAKLTPGTETKGHSPGSRGEKLLIEGSEVVAAAVDPSLCRITDHREYFCHQWTGAGVGRQHLSAGVFFTA